ncbi:ribonuclease HI [Oceanobacillus arenosus]|uniref:Ribonuclease HI n=1 Tax=Oceanobacillus arenosus TaxID=1229153 RepID=A0A3D8Q332_9BACI|nr:RNase H family protein [Oceanobacillus arenosus]RDW22477.1 ribonuclease HI [Oceanobacillus arenosus]
MIEVYTDGASNSNLGLSGAGVYIKANGQNYEYTFPLKVLSNHEAEFHAVIKALEICQKKFPNEVVSLRSDSQVVVDVIDKDFTKNKTFLPLLEVIRGEISHFPYFFIKWIPESNNKNADRLAKKAIHMQR